MVPMSTSPLINATSAGPEPLNGTCTMLGLKRPFSSSVARWLVLPAPLELKFSLPGLRRASAMNSLTFVAGTELCTTMMFWIAATSETGAKSLTAS